MIEYTLTEELINKAKKRLARVSANDHREIKFGYDRARILDGYIGEEIIKDCLNITKEADTFEYDLISNKGKKLEVKTITCKSKPQEDYLCTINAHSETFEHRQKADYYIFIRLLNDYSKAWVLGYMGCNEFFDKATFVPKGTDFGKFALKRQNCYVLEIYKLHKIRIN